MKNEFNDVLGRSSDTALHFSPLTEPDARAVCAWRYEDEYTIYNFPDWETVVAQRWGIADKETRRREFYALRDGQHTLIGFFRLCGQEDFVLLSLGLAPQHCGKGLGKAAMTLIIEEARRRAPGKRLELEVRAFNRRAIACYEKSGFAVVDTYYKETPVGGDTFIRMALNI